MQIFRKGICQAKEKQKPKDESMSDMFMELHVGQCD